MTTTEWVRQRTRKVFYGWWIVTAGIGIQVVSMGLLMQAYGAYVVIMQAEFGWSKTAFSIAFALQRVESGLLGPIQGWMLDRFGPRIVMSAGLSVFGVGFMLFSQVNSLWTFYAVFFFMAVGASLGGFMSIAATVVNWFSRRRATAMGIVHVGMGIGGMLVPVVAWSLSTYGWRATSFVSGLIVLLVGVPLAQFFQHSPERHGLLPDGDDPTEAQKAASDANGEGDEPQPRILYDDSNDFTARQAMRTPSFWLLSVGHGLGVLVVGTVMVHAVVHLNEGLGYTLQAAATVIAMLTATTIVGNLIGGYVGDRMSKRLLAAGCMLFSGGALVLLAWATSFWLIALFAVMQGLAHGVRGVQMMPLRADYFGRKQIATIMGFSSMIVMWGMMSGPVIAGVMADQTGDYRLSFTLMGIVVAAGSLCFLLARKPVHPSQRRRAQAGTVS